MSSDITVIATFNFKDIESKKKFTEFVANPEKGFAVARAWEGCKLMEVYESAEDENTLIIWQKWATKENQESYIKMRKDTGAFVMLREWLASPPQIVSLNPTSL